MSQGRAKTKEKKTAKEGHSERAPYMVMVDIDENARKFFLLVLGREGSFFSSSLRSFHRLRKSIAP